MTKKTDYKYNLFFAGYEGTIEQIGLAQSNDFKNWTIHPAPVLPVGVDNDFDALQTSNPYIFEEDDHYTMIYQARSGDDKRLRFGRATSQNLVTWKKDATAWFEIPLDNDKPGKRDGCQHPHLVKHKNSWHLFFTKQIGSDTQICVATSNDMQKWNFENSSCLTQIKDYESLAIYYPWVIKNKDEWIMWYSAVSGSWKQQNWLLGRAISKDGISWLRTPNNTVQINHKRKWLDVVKDSLSWRSRIQGYANPCVVSTKDHQLTMLTHAVMKKAEMTICLHQSQDNGISWETLNTGIIRSERKVWCHKFDADPFLFIT